MNCIVVDDEPIAREGMADYVRQTPFLNLVASCGDAFEAMQCLQNTSIDLVFLDINMPKLTGVEMLRSLPNAPMIIFATANPNHALDGYDLNAVDYLLKPISYPNFLKACQKANELYLLRHPTQTALGQDCIFIKVDKDLVKIQYDDIKYVEALKDYILIKTTDHKWVTYSSMSKIIEALPADFLKVHRSYIVNKKAVDKLHGNLLYIGDKSIPIGRTYKEVTLSEIVGDNVLKK